ncbi:CHAT domain-containing protein [Caballeronia jiangsuensis]|uniref:CHAT domain-containing protein n=1 Tax=Caballeronia jiangsuensis TaxID=1458357 RepID=A0ABW9CVQ3_9BURK
MPVRNIHGLEYYLILFDEDGNERTDIDGGRLSEAILHRLTDGTRPVTDIFITSHGWKGDIPASIEQYDRWIGVMADSAGDIERMRAVRPGFAPLIVGLHWPSLPWGMEDAAPNAAPGLLGATPAPNPARNEDAGEIVRQLANGLPRERAQQVGEAVQQILGYAQTAIRAELPPEIDDAYARLFAASGIQAGNLSGRPGADQDMFDARVIAEQAAGPGEDDAPAPGVLGLRNFALSPLRQLSFWKMKDRARTFGETGAHSLLIALQVAAPEARIHLMGHSFGSIVVSAMVAGPGSDAPSALRRPVDTLFLVQGALSLWAYASAIPYASGKTGYFRRIVQRGLVSGPIVTTRSSFDTAVGRFYPLGARLKRQLVLGEPDYPEYGGIGAFGIQGASDAVDLKIMKSLNAYAFKSGTIYNVDASSVICNGDGASGAHSDIAHPEVAHLFWDAVLAAAPPEAVPGLLSRSSTRGGSVAPPSVPASAAPRKFARRGGVVFAPEEPIPGLLGGGSSPVPQGGEPAEPGGAAVLEATVSGSVPGPANLGTGEAAAPKSPVRYINADLEDIDPAEPLCAGTFYVLALNVDVTQQGMASEVLLADERALFPQGVEEIALRVQLESSDFEIGGPMGTIRLTRTGRSRTKARFEIAPRHDGPCLLSAIFSKDGNFVQRLDLTIVVGQPREATATSTRGRVLSDSRILQPRDLLLLISPGTGGYECVVCGPVAMRARLPVSAALLDDAVTNARESLMQVVTYQDDSGQYPFQASIDIKSKPSEDALRIMARAGASLLRTVFEGPGAGEDSRAVARLLRRLGTAPDGPPLKLQIIAESMPLPWGMLYLGSAADDAVLDWSNFLGMRHIIEQIPLQQPMTTFDSTIVSNDPVLHVGVNFNDKIDTQMRRPFVGQQRDFWKGLHGERVRVSEHTSWQTLMRTLNNPSTPEQVLYFYCHADSRGLTQSGGPSASSIELTDAARTLNDIVLNAGTDVRLAGSPLVFINACESATMSPAFYDGFAPYFMSKGARGVIGTECKMPALFATEWAAAFFDKFLGGAALGRTFLDLRKSFLRNHNNPLGLLYAVHCDADTCIRPQVPAKLEGQTMSV